jgi:hypothetical protein
MAWVKEEGGDHTVEPPFPGFISAHIVNNAASIANFMPDGGSCWNLRYLCKNPAPRVPLDGLELAAGVDDEQLLAVHEALDRLAAHDAVKAELVKLRFFIGLTIEEAAKVLGLSEPTAKRYWAYARAWLYREIKSV